MEKESEMKRSFPILGNMLLGLSLMFQTAAAESTSSLSQNQTFGLVQNIQTSDVIGLWGHTIDEDGVKGVNSTNFSGDYSGMDLLVASNPKGADLIVTQTFTWSLDSKTGLLTENVQSLEVNGKAEMLPEKPQVCKIKLFKMAGDETIMELTNITSSNKVHMFKIGTEKLLETLFEEAELLQKKGKK